MKLLSHLWLVTLCASRYSVTYAKKKPCKVNGAVWKAAGRRGHQSFSQAVGHSSTRGKEAVLLLLTFLTKQCQWEPVEQVTAPRKNLCCLTLMQPENCQHILYPYFSQFAFYLHNVAVERQTSAQTTVGIQDDGTEHLSQSVSAGQEPVVRISCLLHKLCPFT